MRIFDIFKSNARKIEDTFNVYINTLNEDSVTLNDNISTISEVELVVDKNYALLNEMAASAYKKELIDKISASNEINNFSKQMNTEQRNLVDSDIEFINRDLGGIKTFDLYKNQYNINFGKLQEFIIELNNYKRLERQSQKGISNFNLYCEKEKQVVLERKVDFQYDIGQIQNATMHLYSINEYMYLIEQYTELIKNGSLLPVLKQYPNFKKEWELLIDNLTLANYNRQYYIKWNQDTIIFDKFKAANVKISDYEKSNGWKLNDLKIKCQVNDKLFKFFEQEIYQLVEKNKAIKKAYRQEKYDSEEILQMHSLFEKEYININDKYTKLINPLTEILDGYKFKKENIVEDVSEYYLYSVAKNIEKKKNLFGYSKQISNIEVETWIDTIEEKLYKLTNDQDFAIKQAVKYLNDDNTSSCLIQGDVSCGKTIVIVTLMFILAQKNLKSVFIAPRKILRMQHLKTLQMYNNKFELGLKIVDAEDVNDLNDADIIVSGYSFNSRKFDNVNIALGVIDEIQLFGVNQRSQIQQRYPDIDMLYTTATPHPRTKLISLIGNMDIIEIRQMPKGRIPRITESYKQITAKHISKIESEISKGNMVISVSPLVNKRGVGEYESVKIAHETFKNKFPTKNVELLLATMSQVKKDEILTSAQNGEIDILVATKSIEVGVDLPSASIIFIHYPHSMRVKWGMSQLHQLRGRVGRNNQQSYCYIEAPNTVDPSSPIGSVLQTNDVFELTQKDFDWRGFEKIIGTSQSGGSCTPKEQEQKINAYKTIAQKTPLLVSSLSAEQLQDIENMLSVFYVANIN